MSGQLFQLGSGERRRGGFGGFGRPQRTAGAGGPGQQTGVNQPLQRLVGRAVNDFQAHGRQRVPLAGAEVFLVQGAKLLAVLGGIALDHDVQDRVRGVVRVALLAAEQGAVDALAGRRRRSRAGGRPAAEV